MQSNIGAKLDRAVNTYNHESAAGNVFTLDLLLNGEQQHHLLELVNSCLPEDVFITGCASVDPSFCAKTESKTITYRYIIFKENLNLIAMQKAAALFLGKQNFRRFLSSQYDKTQVDPVVDILNSKIVILEQNSDFLPMAYYEITANTFFAKQVCGIAALIKAVGRGEKQLDEIAAFLQPADHDFYVLVVESSTNLLLYDVKYKNLNFSHSECDNNIVNKYITGAFDKVKRTYCLLKCIEGKREDSKSELNSTNQRDGIPEMIDDFEQ